MCRQFADRPGNYLAFFSSFDYLRMVGDAFGHRSPHTPMWHQMPNMREQDRTRFLDNFTDTSRGIGFAVLGGPFAEGIDLPRDRLIGAFIATLGMPPLNAVNAELERRMHELFGSGYEYTYLYPGLQKVVQAAGRVIRSPSDRGVLHLMDDRFADREVRALLPRWWGIGPVSMGRPA
jgi:DNA excision repair protein ERCC-2